MPSKERRPIRVEGDVAYIPLTQGYEAVIDAKDVALVAGVNWTAAVRKHTVYAHRREVINGASKYISLHRFIMGEPDGFLIDHRDGDGLNNRRLNLRLATASQNGFNRQRQTNNKAGIKGVSWDSERSRWLAQLAVKKKTVLFKRFDTREDAASAYAAASLLHHGEYGRYD